jgi:stress response protein YsnF
MPDELRIPIIEEEARVLKRASDIERVTVNIASEEEQVFLRDELRHEQVEVVRVPVGREVAEAPAVRTEGDLTIVPVLEERLVVEKRLFLVEELHLRRTVVMESVELPTTLRRTRVDIERQTMNNEETDDGRA